MVSMSSQTALIDNYIMITLQFELATKHNSYTILVDGNAFCTALNDYDGLKLMIALETLKAKQNEKNQFHL